MRDALDAPLPELPDLLRIRIGRTAADDVGTDINGSMTVDKDHLAPTEYRHAATAVALAGTAYGYGCLAAPPLGLTNRRLRSLVFNAVTFAPAISS